MSARPAALFLPLALTSLAACSPELQSTALLDLSGLPRTTTESADQTGILEVYFTEPGTERGEERDPLLDDALVELIRASTSTLDLCLYEFKLEAVAKAVVSAHERGVQVRFVGDGDEFEDVGYQILREAGVPIVARPAGSRIMHNKFVVADGQAVWTGSTNLTETGLFQNNNNAILVESTVMAEEYTREFEQMFVDAAFGRAKEDRTEARSFSLGDDDVVFHFAPEHNPIEELISLVDSADHTLHFLIFSYTHPDLLAAMVDAQERGVEVVGIFDESQARGRYSVDEELAQAGIPTFLDGNSNNTGFAGGKLHHKVMLVDVGHAHSDPVLAMGSFNWSKAATQDNDENLVELRDPAVLSLYAQEFCRAHAVAMPHPDFAGEPVDPCTAVPSLRINEFLPNPDGTDRGQEYVEIVNTGGSAVNLQGWTLGDSLNAERHVFGDVVIEPGDGLVVFDRGDHGHVPQSLVSTTGFLSLNNAGDTVVLADPAGAIMDRVDYQWSVSGVSWNRAEDFSEDAPFVLHVDVVGAGAATSPGTRVGGEDFTHVPTPEFQVVLNEVLPNPVGTDRGQEYVEIVNLGPDEADLSGFVLSDRTGERHDFRGTVLAPGEALVLFDQGDHSGVPGWDTTTTGGLSLNNAGDTLTLRDDTDGIHDQITWPDSVEGVAWNRAKDGSLDPTLALHDEVDPDGTAASPGTRADGTAW